MNEKLESLYEKKWPYLTDFIATNELKSASPLLIKVSDDYQVSNVKVMVVGQETDGWFGVFKDKKHSVETLMNGYYDYFYRISSSGKNRLKRPFWNKKNFKYFEDKMTSHFKKKDLSVGFVWSNISKIGKVGRGIPDKVIRQAERKYFNVFKDEVDILNPDVIIFTTGSRDGYIKHHFGSSCNFVPKLCFDDGLPVESTANLIAEVELPSFKNVCAVRVQHPNRRALDNGVILKVILDCWEKKYNGRHSLDSAI